MPEEKWQTAITKIKPNEVRLRGYRIDELMGRITYAEGVYLALRGELPDARVGRLIDACLVSSIDHGVTPPSALAAMNAASTGAPLNAAVASGVLAINRWHGGAIENAMHVIREVIALRDSENVSLDEAANAFVLHSRETKRKVEGFGHRVHTNDPRTARLFALAGELKLAGDGVAAAEAIEKAMASVLGKQLPINVDGAIAAVLVDLGFEPDVANAFFIMSRVPGLVAHALEEMTRQKPMRRIEQGAAEYDGPPDRELPEDRR